MNQKILITLFLLSISWLITRYFFPEVKGRTPDEYYYEQQALVINDLGHVKGARALMVEYNRDPWRWENPPPSRIGYTFLVALSQWFDSSINTKIFTSVQEKDAYTISVGARVSLIASFLTLLVVFRAGLLTSGLIAATISSLLFIFSPLELAISRRSWSESTLVLVCSIIFLSCLEIRTSKFKNVWFLIYAFFSGFSLWVKESGPFFAALCSLVAVLPLKEKEERKDFLKLFIYGSLGVVISYLLLSYFLGGLDQLMLVKAHIQEAVPKAIYAKTYQDGPWYYFLLSSLLLTPSFSWLLIISLLVYSLLRYFEAPQSSDKHCNSMLGIIALCLLFLAIASWPLYFKNLRYIAPLLVPLIIFIAKVLASTITPLRSFKITNLVLLIGLFLALLFCDYQKAVKLKEQNDLTDLNLVMLRQTL